MIAQSLAGQFEVIPATRLKRRDDMSDEVVQPFGNDWEAEDEPVRGTLVNPVRSARQPPPRRSR